MTKSYLMNEIEQNFNLEPLEQNIIARRFTIRTICNQMNYNLQVYFRNNLDIIHIIIFSFLGFIQLFFYTLGAYLEKLQYKDSTSQIK